MTSDVTTLRNPVQEVFRTEAHEMNKVSWLSLIAGVLWIVYGMFVLSYRVGSLTAVAALAGVALLFGGVSELVAASRAYQWRGLHIVSGILGIGAGIVAFIWPSATLFVLAVLVGWYLVSFGVIHIITALAGPKIDLWWTQLLLGIGELVLGIWAVRSWEHSMITLVTLVGTWAIWFGMSELFAAFTLHQASKDTKELAG